ncbi:PspA/IM30 family protein [Cryobacterium shii]|uniref:PspA/IM30 family protein n=1 Tax=Cryobacterium shii TaxID=1259235 RepID=A0AAQ2C3A1_9MICO|nr:PspA/IM30 family protein [Cryobacterium shii]TFC41745.1 PspA/IM30 family protein [Cryobacterium shii]
MTISSRLRVILRSKSSRALTRLEDPREALDDSYEQQVRMLQQMRQGLAEVATTKKRIELQGQEMGSRYQRLADQAQEALNQGREDLARTALERRSLLESQVAALQNQYTALEHQQAQLHDNERRLAERVAAFRTEKETIKATYSASEARVRANQAAAGIGSQMSDVGINLDRAKDRVAQMQARAAATDELLSSGALSDATAAPDADLERQLSAGTTKADVDRQLQAMKNARASRPGSAPGTGPGSRGGARPQPGTDAWLSIGQGPNTP